MKKRKNTIIILSILLLSIGALVFSCLNVFNIVRFFKTSITLAIKNNEYTYNGKALETLNYEIKNGSLIDGDEIYFVFETEVKDAKTYYRNTFNYKILDRNHIDVSSSYNITEEFEDIVVNKRELTIETDSKTFYKTSNNKAESVKILSGSLCDGHYIQTVNFNSYSNDGSYQNRGSVLIYDKNNTNVTSNYNIRYKYGLIYIYGNNETIPDDSPDESVGDELEEQDGDGSANGMVDFDMGGEGEVILRYKPYSNNQGNLMFASPILYGSYDTNKFKLAKKYSNNNGIETYGFVQELLMESGNYEVLSGELEYVGVNKREYDYVESYPIFQNQQNNDTYFVESNLKDKTIKTQFLNYDYYSNHSLLDNLSFNDTNYANEENKYYSFVQSQYLGVDNSTRNGINTFLRKYNIWQNNSVFEVAQKLMMAFKNDFVYSLNGVTSLAANNPVLDFLNNTRKGRCQNFAEAAVIIYRCLGYPARPIVGYAIKGANVANKSVYATNMDKHERAQVYLKGKGWVTFEFTVAPEYDNDGGGGGEMPDEDYSNYDFVLEGNDHEITYDGKEHDFTDYKIIKEKKGDFNYYVIPQFQAKYVCAGTYESNFSFRITKNENNSYILINNQFNILETPGKITINKKELKQMKWSGHSQPFDLLSKSLEITMDNRYFPDLVDGDVIKSFRILNYEDFKSPGTYNAVIVPEIIYNTNLNINVTNSYEFEPFKLSLQLN